MATFRLSRLAEADLIEIGAYTLRAWGEDQAIRYIDGVGTCCHRLADNPQLGRVCDYIRPGLRRMEHARHVVSCRIEAGGIRISRILHQRMLPERQRLDEGEPVGSTE